MAKETKKSTDVAVIERVALSPPRMWHVWLINDDQTSMEFVVLVLMQIFHRSFEDAQNIMMHVHQTGRGIAGTYSHEIAITKRDETIGVARGHGFPLVAEISVVD
jgi:ATP-dependent Clp protease adaptor protein ClpS